MKGAKCMSMPLGGYFSLSEKFSLTNNEEKEVIEKIPYTSILGSLIYDTMYIRLEIAHATSVVRRYLASPCKQHGKAIK